MLLTQFQHPNVSTPPFPPFPGHHRLLETLDRIVQTSSRKEPALLGSAPGCSADAGDGFTAVLLLPWTKHTAGELKERQGTITQEYGQAEVNPCSEHQDHK